MMNVKQVLGIGAHPDDVELGAGALLSLLHSQGSEITLLVVSKGELGAPGTKDEALTTRVAEQQAAADSLRARLFFMNQRDGYIRFDADLVQSLERFVEGDPLILLPSPEGGESIGPYYFTTALAADDRKTPFRFAVYGDTRSFPDRHTQVADAILRSRPRVTLALGDLGATGSDRASWDTEFFRPARAMGAYVPMLPCYGNHEQNTRYLTNLFDLPGNGHWFTFDYGYVRIITLDVEQPYGPGSEQRKWLKKELARKWKGWLFCQFPEPPYGTCFWRGPNRAVAMHLVPLFLEHGVDAIFCAHDHYYMRSKPIALEEGQRGTVQFISAGGGAPLYPFEDAPHVAAQKAAFHHIVLDVSPEQLTGKAITPDGKVIDTFVMKKHGEQPELIIAPKGRHGDWRKAQGRRPR